MYNLLAVLVTSKDKQLAGNTCEAMATYVKDMKKDHIAVIGPAKAGIGRINDVYRFVFYIKGKDNRALTDCKDKLEEGLREIKDLQVYFDFNPMSPY